MSDKPLCTRVQIDNYAPDLHSGAKLSYKSIIGHSAEKIKSYARSSLSENTWLAYEGDLKHFYDWGGKIPASADMIAAYISDYAGKLAVATLERRLASLSKAHEMQNVPSPVKSETVNLVMKGIRREHSIKQKQAAPLLRDDLIAILNQMGDDVKGRRDAAILMIGFAGAFRRSELVALNIEDVEIVEEGVIITVHKSKTDQEGLGRKIAIPKGRSRYCPCSALQSWLQTLNETEGPIFRSVRKGGNIQPSRLSNNAVSCLVKDYVEQIGLDPTRYSGHSLRSGFITSAAQLGIPEWRIMRQSGHKSHATMMRYVRDSRLFEDHPLEKLF